ncbi:hybrid sensor histidine kinase/response regulator [Azospirillum rugosum]|uniref:histidine kinase n=1 Tax=Azospirillum rugosum TaxID=416170 RepID=A0ABS4SST0_9PROT|nr:ATP-binding protein [Azospirillum rugosum]MBP2295618.1 PAS domain S-box-containing protein [Azospirillum rugosum]MDQ0529492.1 PAS domain S-box-containing protein [Azospirillum rugosum]
MLTTEFLLGLAQNIGLFAVVVMAFLQVRARAASPTSPLAQALLGLLFGGAAILGMLDPIRVAPGVLVDGRNVIVALAGPFAGPAGGVVAALAAGGFRWWMGGAGAVAGVASLGGAALIGIAFHAIARRRGEFSSGHLLALAVAVAVASPASFVLLPDDLGRQALRTVLVPLLLGNLLGTLILGTMLRKERQRQDLAQALVESQRRFAATAANVPGGVYQRVLTTDGRLVYPYASPGVFQVFGVPEAHPITAAVLKASVHPDDYPGLMASVMQSATTLEPWTHEFRVVRADDGSERWLRATSRVYRRESGRESGEVVWDGIILDVTDSKRNEQALILARVEAEQASRAKAEFLAAMSHEMRTPLNGILGFTQLLLDGELSPLQRRQATHVRDAGRFLLTVIDDVLDFSRIEAGRLDLHAVDFALRDLVASCEAVLRPDAGRKGLALHVSVAPDVPGWLRGDPDRLRQVILNLLGNAVKFTEHGSVALSVVKTADTPDGARLTVSVVDTGIGIAEDRQGELFQRFSQIDRSRGGTGLGLAISRRLVEVMGGEVGVRSRPGIGSTFWFTLTLPEAAPPADRANPCAPELRAPRRPARILLAEDLPMNRELAVSMLAAVGHRVDTAADGREAVEAASRGGYDLILMDVQMPVMDGLAATAAIRALPPPQGSVPILAMSASALPAEVARCVAAGMDGHVAKPIDRAALLDAIDQRLNDRRLTACPVPIAADPGPPPPTPVAAVLDLDHLRRMGRDIGEDSLARLVDCFLAELPERLARLERPADDPDGAAFEAHALISLAANVGLAELSALSRQLHTAIRAGRRDEAEALAVRVAGSAAAGVAALRPALAPPSPQAVGG